VRSELRGGHSEPTAKRLSHRAPKAHHLRGGGGGGGGGARRRPIHSGFYLPPEWKTAGAVMPTEADVPEAPRPGDDPQLHRSIVDLDMVREIAIEGGAVRVTVALTVQGCPLRTEITNRVGGAVTALPGVDEFDIDFTVMTDEEREALRGKLGHSHAA